MHTRSSTIIAGGVVVAVLGAIMVFAYARSVEGSPGSGNDVAAYVATTDVPAGTTWEEAVKAFKESKVPEVARPHTAVADIDTLKGLKAVRTISQGEVVTSTQFGATEAPIAGGLDIPPGQNAVTVNVGAPQGVARYPQAGDIVNIFTTIKDPSGEGTRTQLMLSNVQVLSTSTPGADGPAGGGEALLTLALTPGDAEKVIFVKENGSLWFGLVHPGDGPVSSGGRTFDNVLS